MSYLPICRLQWNLFSIGEWYAEQCVYHNDIPDAWVEIKTWQRSKTHEETDVGHALEKRAMAILHLGTPYEEEADCPASTESRFEVHYELPKKERFIITDKYRGLAMTLPQGSLEDPGFDLLSWYSQELARIDGVILDIIENTSEVDFIELSGVQVDRNKYPSLQRNAAQVKGNHRILPKPVVVKVTINNHPARALLDSGSLGDFISTTLTDQLGVKRDNLETPLSLQLAVQASSLHWFQSGQNSNWQ
ncbi:hypothetical protein BYT27DRAFT_7208252 [Phlegmacium glaucopus]|nr:hypothetical protein BYT27DRAFT_7208252 [Phlegmacium glaucopus]